MDVTRPDGPPQPAPHELPRRAAGQIELAAEILSDPGGGLLFATQGIGQARAALNEADSERWEKVVSVLHEAEDAAIRREYDRARQLLAEALGSLT